MVNFEIQTKEMLKTVKIDLNNESVRVESGAMYYMMGKIAMEAAAPSAKGLLKSFVSGEKAVRPVYSGTGTIYLEPSYGEFTILDLNNEEWILDKSSYYASDMSIAIDIFKNKAMAGIMSGEGFFQTKVSGKGKVVMSSTGPLERIELKNDKLVVDGNFAIARTGNIEFKVEKASKGLFGTMISGEGLVNTFEGTGTVLISPVPFHYSALMNRFNLLHSAISGMRSS